MNKKDLPQKESSHCRTANHCSGDIQVLVFPPLIIGGGCSSLIPFIVIAFSSFWAGKMWPIPGVS